MAKWYRLPIESENVGIIATQLVALISNAWAEDGTLKDVELYYRRMGDSSLEYILSPAAAVLVRRTRTLEPFRSKLAQLDEKPDLSEFRPMRL